MGSQERLPGQRAGSCLARAARGLRQGHGLTSLLNACQRASRDIGWLSVVVRPQPLAVDCAEVLGRQQAGQDPLGAWRAACAADLAEQYQMEPPAQVAAVFVLQWYLSAVAQPLAHLAGLVGVIAPDRISFERSGPGGYPVRVAVAAADGHSDAQPGDDVHVRAERAYRDHAEAFAQTYQPGVRLSSATRAGSVQDAWDAARAGTDPAWSAPRWRASCCFIYALPGTHECARCPRLRTAPEG